MKKIKEQKNQFLLDTDTGYFRNNGVDVMAFDDIYPVGHQSGVSIIMHGSRIATNGDIRFEQTPTFFSSQGNMLQLQDLQ